MTIVSRIILLIIATMLGACGGGSGSSSGNSTAGAPPSIMGYTVTMNVEQVEIIQDSTFTNFMEPGDTATWGFVDEHTIYGDDKFSSKINMESWEYSTSGDKGIVDLYQSGGEHHITYAFNSSTSGNFTWIAESYSSGAMVKYSGTFTTSGHDSAGGDTSGFASTLQGTWTSVCNDGYEMSLVFSGSKFSMMPTFYDNADCSDAGDSFPDDVVGNYVIRNEITTESGMKAWQIDITYMSIDYPEDYDVSVGQTHYDIISVTGDTLYLGNDASGLGSSTSTRPTQLDFTDPFTADN